METEYGPSGRCWERQLFADIFIDEDLSAASLEIKKTLWNAHKKGKELYADAKISIQGRYLTVNECKYDVDSLPYNLKTKQTTPRSNTS